MLSRWMTIPVCGSMDYQVLVGKRISGDGSCQLRKLEIKVRLAAHDHMVDTLIHEVTHAVWDATGLNDQIRRKYLGKKITEELLEELEEDVISHQTPGLVGTMKLAGWLNIPAYSGA